MARPSACLCFQVLLEFTAGIGKGSHREVNGLQDKGRSCWGKSGGRERRRKEEVQKFHKGKRKTDRTDKELL